MLIGAASSFVFRPAIEPGNWRRRSTKSLRRPSMAAIRRGYAQATWPTTGLLVAALVAAGCGTSQSPGVASMGKRVTTTAAAAPSNNVSAQFTDALK